VEVQLGGDREEAVTLTLHQLMQERPGLLYGRALASLGSDSPHDKHNST
jgi:hypothetical protein